MPLLLSAMGARAETCFLTTYPLSFGNYNPMSLAPLDTIGQLGVDCRPPSWANPDQPVYYTISLGKGQHSSGTYHPRNLAQTLDGSLLAYNLYRDAARVEVWGDGTETTFVVVGVGEAPKHEFLTTLTIYARIPPRQDNVTVGDYGDVITVTVSF